MNGSICSSKFSSETVFMVCKELAQLLSAGLTIEHALFNLSNYLAGDEKFIFLKIRELVREGNTLWESIEKFPKYFSTFFVSAVRVGEQTGTLGDQLLKISTQAQREMNLVKNVNKIFNYPKTLFLTALAFLLINMMAITPLFTSENGIFRGSGVLKGITVLKESVFWGSYLYISDFLSKNWILSLVGVLVCYLILELFLHSVTGNSLKIAMISLLPGYGIYRKEDAYSRFFFILQAFISGGMSFSEGIREAGRGSGSKELNIAGNKIADSIEYGLTLSSSFQGSRAFEDSVYRMIGTVENTGNYVEEFLNSAQSYHQKAEERLERIITVLRPIFNVFMGLVVLFQLYLLLYPVLTIAFSSINSLGLG